METSLIMRPSLGLSLGLGLLLASSLAELVGSGIARAAMADCMNADGSCVVNNDAGDFVACECTSGESPMGGGANDWAGLSEVELQPICDEQLALLCPPPPVEIMCV